MSTQTAGESNGAGGNAAADLEHLSAAHEEDAVEVDAVHVGAVVGKHRGERPPDDLAAVDDDDGFAAHSVAEGELVIVHFKVLHELDDSEWGAREERLLGP